MYNLQTQIVPTPSKPPSKMTAMMAVETAQTTEEPKPSAYDLFVANIMCAELCISNAIAYTLAIDDNASAPLIMHMKLASAYVMGLVVPPETNLLVHDYVVAVQRIMEPFLVLEAYSCDTALTVCENMQLYLGAMRVALG